MIQFDMLLVGNIFKFSCGMPDLNQLSENEIKMCKVICEKALAKKNELVFENISQLELLLNLMNKFCEDTLEIMSKLLQSMQTMDLNNLNQDDINAMMSFTQENLKILNIIPQHYENLIALTIVIVAQKSLNRDFLIDSLNNLLKHKMEMKLCGGRLDNVLYMKILQYVFFAILVTNEKEVENILKANNYEILNAYMDMYHNIK